MTRVHYELVEETSPGREIDEHMSVLRDTHTTHFQSLDNLHDCLLPTITFNCRLMWFNLPTRRKNNGHDGSSEAIRVAY